MSRRKAVALIFCGTWLLGALCSLSFGPLSGFKMFGETIFNFCDKLCSNYLMTLGALLFSIFVGWKMDKESVRDELTNGGLLKLNGKIFPVLYFLIKYVTPITIAAIFISGLIG